MYRPKGMGCTVRFGDGGASERVTPVESVSLISFSGTGFLPLSVPGHLFTFPPLEHLSQSAGHRTCLFQRSAWFIGNSVFLSCMYVLVSIYGQQFLPTRGKAPISPDYQSEGLD